MSSTAVPLAHYLGAGLAGATLTALGISLSCSYSARIQRPPVRVLITAGAGQIAYALAPLIARGLMLGENTPVIIHLYDKPAALNALHAVRLELLDMALPNLSGVVVAVDLAVACRDVEVAVMVGGYAQRQGVTREEAFRENVHLYAAQGAALQQHASRHVRVVVVANPANTSALILRATAPSVPPENITALTRLDHNRALALLAETAHVRVKDVHHVTVWGNHSHSQVADVGQARVGGHPVSHAINDEEWLEEGVVSAIRQRTSNIVQLRNMSPAASAASAICDHVRDWLLGTRRGEWVSMGVMSDGSYGIPEGVCFSFPVTCHAGRWAIVPGLRTDTLKQDKVERSLQELLDERTTAYRVLEEELGIGGLLP